MNSNRSTKPYRTTLLVGILASIILIVLGAIILAQLLIAPFDYTTRPGFEIIDSRIVETVIFTIYQAALSTIMSILIGAILAWSLANNQKFVFRNILVALISSALVLPTLVVVLGIVTVYGRNGWLAELVLITSSEKLPFSIYGLGGILLAHIFFNASFACRILLHRFESIADEKHKLCFALGIGFWRRLILVEFRAISSALPSLAITIFLLCFTSFAIVLTLGGSPSYNTLEVAIYEAVRFDFDLPRAFQLAMVQIAICIILVIMANARVVGLSASASAKRLSGFRFLYSRGERVSQIGIIILFSLFFVTPLIAVCIDGSGSELVEIFKKQSFQSAFINSIAIASASTTLALSLSFAIASAIATLSLSLRLTLMSTNSPLLSSLVVARVLGAIISASAMFYLVFPALVMGLGFFLLYQRMGGDPVIWAACVVTLANAFIAVPFAVAILHPAIEGAAKRHDRLAVSLGLGRLTRWRQIDWPVIKSDITYAAALCFCFSLGDLGVIALFGNEDFKTLPWLLYQNFGSYRTDEASAIALVLLMLVIAVFWIAQNLDSREQLN